MQDRAAEHLRLAKILQVSEPEKRAKAQAKAAETRARKKAAREGPTAPKKVTAEDADEIHRGSPNIIDPGDDMQS